MEKVKIAKDEAVPQLKEDGSNYELWRSSYLAYYCCQMEVVMAIASDPSVKPQKIGTEEEKMLTTTIFKSIHPRLRVVYINQKDLLKNGYKLWEALEERFQALDQQEQDMEKFLTAKQGNRPLHKFVVEYDNLRRKLGMCLSKIMDEAAMIRHLHRALSPLSQTLFPLRIRPSVNPRKYHVPLRIRPSVNPRKYSTTPPITISRPIHLSKAIQNKYE